MGMALEMNENESGANMTGAPSDWNTSASQVRALQKRLLQKAMASWPRRDRPLLEINCGDGAFLHFFWQSGFDVVATEENPELRIRIINRGLPIDLRGAKDDDLPFEDDCFDWVILNTRHEESERLKGAFQEALRVVKRGIMITFWNRTSLAGIWTKLPPGKKVLPAGSLSVREVMKLAHSFSINSLKIYSTLCLPDFTWHHAGWLKEVNGWFSDAPFGAWCVVSMMPGNGKLVTPLPLALTHKYGQVESQLDYVQKREVKNHENCNSENQFK